MNEHFMENTSGCDEGASLVAYLYDECEPGEREAVAAHLATCLACTAELQALSDTRRMLPAWAPPEATLGLQMTAKDDAPAATVLRPARWWQRPLPAWAQAAAAVLIFVAGLSAGRARDTAAPRSGAADRAAAADTAPASVGEQAAGQAATPAAVPAASREELARLERDLRSEIARIAQARRTAGAELQRASISRSTAAPAGGMVTLEQVEALITDSERRQRNQLILAMGEVVADVEARQIRALTPVRQAVEGLGREAELNRGSVSALVNAVSAQGGLRLVGGR